MKNQKLVSLDKDVAEDIKHRKDNFGFNFSEWVNTEYRHDFMSLNAKQKEIDIFKKKIEMLEKEVFEMSEKDQTFSENISRNEKRFLLTIYDLISEGKTWKGLLNRFNLSFHKEWRMEQFKKVVKYLKDENGKKTC